MYPHHGEQAVEVGPDPLKPGLGIRTRIRRLYECRTGLMVPFYKKSPVGRTLYPFYLPWRHGLPSKNPTMGAENPCVDARVG